MYRLIYFVTGQRRVKTFTTIAELAAFVAEEGGMVAMGWLSHIEDEYERCVVDHTALLSWYYEHGTFAGLVPDIPSEPRPPHVRKSSTLE